MRNTIALVADLVTIVGVVTLFAFLISHPVANRLGVWAGALQGNRVYGWKRQEIGLRRWLRWAVMPLLSLLSRLGGETRQTMRPAIDPSVYADGVDPDIAGLLAPYRRSDEDIRRSDQERSAREQRLMDEATERIAMRRWRREHRRVRCDDCEQSFQETLLLCIDDCSWSEQRPKRLRHLCRDCMATRMDAISNAEPD